MTNINTVSVHTNTRIITGEILETLTKSGTTLALVHYTDECGDRYEYYVLYEKSIAGSYIVRQMNRVGAASKLIGTNEKLRKSGLAIAIENVIAA